MLHTEPCEDTDGQQVRMSIKSSYISVGKTLSPYKMFPGFQTHVCTLQPHCNRHFLEEIST